jgi:hypothetical protein
METNSETVNVNPPRLIGSVVAGFNAVASHIYLIIFPVTLDLLLWLGPHVRVKALLAPSVNNFFTWVAASDNSADIKDLLKSSQDLLQSMLAQANLLVGLRTWPVGVPSLFFGAPSMQTPMGSAPIIEMPNLLTTFLTWILIILTGTLAGSVFFNSVSNASFDQKKPFSVQLSLWQFGQCILLAVLLVVLVILILIPFSLIVSLFGIFSPALAEFAAWAILFLLIWLLLPLIFSAHGIFVFNFNSLISITTSVRLVRFFLPGAGVFLVMAFLLNEGMDIIWRMSPASSWLTLAGVAGHGFIGSALLAGSFIYYGSGMRWMHDNLQRTAPQASKA